MPPATNIFCDLSILNTESDVEQKLLYPLLSEVHGLGYNEEEIMTKQYLTPTDIDKGAGKKVGYYPDYAILLSSLFSLVVEAKAPDESVEEGFREAQLYAHELNKRYPQGVNPVSYVIACNGIDLLYGVWDNASPSSISCKNLCPGLEQYEDFRRNCSRNARLPFIKELRNKLFPNKRFNPLKLLGGPTKQNAELAPNRFAKDLIPVLKRYFDPDITRSSKEIIEKAYVSSDQYTRYNSLLEALLKDNLTNYKYPLFEKLSTSKKEAPEFTKTLKELMADKNLQNPLLLLIGGVGSGKSMFIDRYYYFLLDDELKKNTLWAFVDFNQAPDDLSNLGEWIVSMALENLKIRNKLTDMNSFENLSRYFAPQIHQRDIGPYKIIKSNQPEEYERRIAADLVKWGDNPNELLKGFMRYCMGDKGIKVAVVFDNADRRDAEQQLRIFQEAQHFRAEYGSFCIMALRDETYERFKNEPPLDAFFKPFAFKIMSPRFIDVVKKRLHMVIEELAANAPKKLQYELPNNIVIEYPRSDLGEYLISIYRSIFNPTRRVRLILEALAGRDIRYALQMFVDILTSGYMKDEFVFAARYGKEQVDLGEWLVIRILMKTKYRYYSKDHGYILNLFQIDETSSTTNNFILCEILAFLSRSRKQQGELGIEGYRRVDAIVKELATFGYLTEDIFWGLHLLAKRGLIIADHQRAIDINRSNYVKITASGHYHLNMLLNRVEYLGNVSMDTALRDQQSAKEIANFDGDSLNHINKRINLLQKALAIEAKYCIDQCGDKESAGRKLALDSISSALEWQREQNAK